MLHSFKWESTTRMRERNEATRFLHCTHPISSDIYYMYTQNYPLDLALGGGMVWGGRGRVVVEQ